MDSESNETSGQRLDKWLWYARFFKSRTLAGKLLTTRRFRINKRIVEKASTLCHVGDVLTFPQGKQIRIVRILDLGQRRGPATEAQSLYDDLTPPAAKPEAGAAPASPTDAARPSGSGRPTKRDRRKMDRWREMPDGQN